MWAELICGLVLYRLVKRCFDEEDDLTVLDSSHSDALFAVANRFEKIYYGSKVYVGLQIPDPESASRRNIDLVLVTNHEAVVISVKNVAGFISPDKDGNWVCTDGNNHKTECIPNPVVETQQLVSILEEYLERRGVALPEGYLSFKVVCSNPNFRSIHSDSFPPEIITYDQWSQLKPEERNLFSGWIKGALGRKKKMHESFCEKLNSVLSTAPFLDRLELMGNKYVLGEFVEFKGKHDDLQALRKIRRSKVSRLTTVQKFSMFGFAHSTIRVLYAPRDYRAEETSWSSQWEEVSIRLSTEVVFHPQSCAKPLKCKMSSVMSMSLSA